ncbi:hypothetical protein P4244_04780 [Bacillus thuringiensis]|nr:hypothetical protein [Bacillus thuringiensis]
MTIQVLCRIKLPYVIELNGDVDVVSSNYQCEIFKTFELTFLHNNEDDDEIYDPNFSNRYCRYILIKCIIKDWNINTYTLRTSGIKVKLLGSEDKKDIILVENVPDTDRNKIFKLISKKFNDLLYYIRISTGMFWLKPISINNISGVMGTNTSFCFYTEDSPVRNLNYSITYHDSFMVNINTQPLNNDLLRNYLITEKNWKKISQDYLHKAKTALFEDDYPDAIIYASISAESFIKSYISSITVNEHKDDIIFEKLINSSGQYILDSYYNVILKYVRGKSLIEIDEIGHQKLSSLYKLRNAIMHKGLLDEESLQKAGLKKLGHEECQSLLDAVESIQINILKIEKQWQSRLTSESKPKFLSFEVLEISQFNNQVKVSFKFKHTNYFTLLNKQDLVWEVSKVYHAGSGCECGSISFLCHSRKIPVIIETLLIDYITNHFQK